MSSRPVSENVFIGPFNKLQYIRNDLVRSVCYGELISFFDHLQTEPFFFQEVLYSPEKRKHTPFKQFYQVLFDSPEILYMCVYVLPIGSRFFQLHFDSFVQHNFKQENYVDISFLTPVVRNSKSISSMNVRFVDFYQLLYFLQQFAAV